MSSYVDTEYSLCIVAWSHKNSPVNNLPGRRPKRAKMMKNGDILDILVENAMNDADGFKSLNTDDTS